ncbi:MAG: hypothetical protein LBU34_05610 [Planctomycetaceae bacterium]|nr:hypothetical protein [Planctomycetaceae bacterium]
MRTRKTLQKESALGEYGAAAIHREMSLHCCPFIPSIRTINRILQRHGCFDSRHRIRYESPPRGWYLPKILSVMPNWVRLIISKIYVFNVHMDLYNYLMAFRYMVI